MTDYKKYKNDYLRDIIQKHFAKLNKRVTNLQTANKDKLLDLIGQHNIDIPVPELHEDEVYSIRKEGKTNILVINTHEYRVSQEFVHHIERYNEEDHHILAIIEKITPKQVHFTLNKTVHKISTQDFIKIINEPKILTMLDFLRMCRSS